MQIAVLTGDLIDSTSLRPGSINNAFEALRRAATEIAEWQGASTRFTRHRGDGWQMMLTKPRFALRAALKMTAALQALSEYHATRISVAKGKGNPGRGDTLGAATGPAFIESGRTLDHMDPRVRLTSAARGKEAAIYRLADYVARGWTPAQSRAVEPFLQPEKPTQEEVAQRLGITRQAVQKALTGAGFGAIEQTLKLVEEDDD